MKILFTSPIIGWPAMGGPELRIKNTVSALTQMTELHIVSRAPLGNEAEAYYRRACQQYSCALPNPGPSSSWRLLRALQRTLRRTTGDQNLAAYIIDYADAKGIKIIWCGYGNISYDLMKEIKAKRPELKVVCDTDSVWSRFILRGLPYETDPEKRKRAIEDGRRKEREEREWVEMCDITTGVSDIDVAYYRSIASDGSRIALLSNVVDLKDYSDVPSPPGGHVWPNIYLGGSFWQDSPMERGTRWFIGSVLPLVRVKIPDIRLYVVGRGADVVLSDIRERSVSIVGAVRTTLPYIRHASVAVVPLMFESGTRYKILEAGACGIPVVSTTLGIEGIPAKHNDQVLIADDAPGFADAIVGLIQDKDRADVLAGRCRALVEERFGIDALKVEAAYILGKLR